MILQQISILNYKNIQQTDLHLSPKINYFLGKNAMGKTNLLDAVYYLSFCKSHINVVDTHNIAHNEEFCLLQATYCFGDRQEQFLCSIRRKQKKQFKREKKDYERLSDHIGVLPLVMVSPADTELIAGSSEGRRRFMDMILSQFDKPYLQALLRYNKALQQRNALLKADTLADDSLMDIWEEQMWNEGRIIHMRRKQFIEEFTPLFDAYYRQIASTDAEDIRFSHQSQLNTGVDLLTLLRQSRAKDRILGYTTVGVHKDDLLMNLGDYAIKRVGSQGQNKTFVIAMKLAQFDLMAQCGHTKPILLLDDIFDKLDALRVEQIIRIVSQDKFGQIFITDTNRKHLDDIILQTNSPFHLYQVEGGAIELLS